MNSLKARQAKAARHEANRAQALKVLANHDHLSYTGLRDIMKIDSRLIQPLLNELEAENLVESFTFRNAAHHHVEHFCLYGRRPRPAAASKLSGWPQTLAGFREAVTAAYAAGNNPFKVAA